MIRSTESDAAPPPPVAAMASAGPDLLQLMGLLRSHGGELFEHGVLHGQLVQLEWAIERRRLVAMAAAILVGTLALGCMMACVGVLALVLGWDTGYRVATIVALIATYAIALGLAGRHLVSLSARGSQSFSATRAELAADFAALKGQT